MRTLCSVADPARALTELRRVLGADGRLILMSMVWLHVVIALADRNSLPRAGDVRG